MGTVVNWSLPDATMCECEPRVDRPPPSTLRKKKKKNPDSHVKFKC